MWTVQAPQSAMPQPNLVPVRPSVSRRTQSSGVCGVGQIDRLAVAVESEGDGHGVPFVIYRYGHRGDVIFPCELEFAFAAAFVGEGVLERLRRARRVWT